uniref:Uncharacterized protein MANES_18G138700 n=1 Tax=Rhizophora mucronata TaxID=61149 RepID=A0A2P2JMH6_RHIMU
MHKAERERESNINKKIETLQPILAYPTTKAIKIKENLKFKFEKQIQKKGSNWLLKHARTLLRQVKTRIQNNQSIMIESNIDLGR